VVKASFSMRHKLSPGNCLRKSDYLLDGHSLSVSISLASTDAGRGNATR
jgi:hypothetical protein